MSSATVCFSGFSRDENALLLRQFELASAELQGRWTLAPEADARVLVIDMDSMYGHLTWLQARSGGKTTIGLTAGERSETDYLLRRPMTPSALKSVLEDIGNGIPASPVTAPVAAPEPEPTVESRPNPSADYIAAITTGQMAAMPQLVVPHQPRISDYMASGVLGGPTKVQIAGAPALAFDPGSQTYVGSATLKPLVPYVEAVVSESEFTAIDAAEFEKLKASYGGAHPYMRLLWLCGLSVGKGELLPGYSVAKKFLLTKWPQIEREFPKHFRLATVMMKGPAHIKEIAEASGVPAAEVVDFINAGLLAGSVVTEGATTAAGDIPKAIALLAKPRST